MALGGSQASGLADPGSDIDLYVYAATEVPVDERRRLAAEVGSSEAVEIDNRFFETGDEWTHAASGIHIDIMYRDPRWIEGELDRVLVRHEASVGYTTCLWFNVLTARGLVDRRAWYAGLQRRAGQPYPEGLMRAIVAKNLPLLAANRGSFLRQMDAAARRGDRVSLNHRAAAFLASYFDVLFAFNRRPHPGEKRMVEHARRPEMIAPNGFVGLVDTLVGGLGDPSGARAIATARALAQGVSALVDRPARP